MRTNVPGHAVEALKLLKFDMAGDCCRRQSVFGAFVRRDKCRILQ
jgi:hypothetical protein